MAQLLQEHSFTEKELIGHSLAGDKAALSQLVNANQKTFLEKVTRELSPRDNDRAADIAQQALTDICGQLAAVDSNRPFIDSLMDAARIFVNTQAKNPERSFTDIKTSNSLGDKRKVAEAESDFENPESLIAAQETKAALQTLSILETMKRRGNIPGISYLFAICVKGHTIEQIARREKITPDHVETAVRSACLSMPASLKMMLSS